MDFKDIVQLTGYEMTRTLPRGYLEGFDTLRALGWSPEEVRRSLHTSARGDYFEDHIDSMPIRDERRELTEADHYTLDMAIRLANATWKAGQVHRAAWEGNNSRIDLQQREAFNPFDLLKRQQFEVYTAQGFSPVDALVRVAFEVYKDKVQYDPLVR